MKTLTLAGLALACAGLSACASNGAVAEKALNNLEYCERTYTAAIGALGSPGGALAIRCPARPFPATAPTP